MLGWGTLTVSAAILPLGCGGYGVADLQKPASSYGGYGDSGSGGGYGGGYGGGSGGGYGYAGYGGGSGGGYGYAGYGGGYAGYGAGRLSTVATVRCIGTQCARVLFERR